MHACRDIAMLQFAPLVQRDKLGWIPNTPLGVTLNIISRELRRGHAPRSHWRASGSAEVQTFILIFAEQQYYNAINNYAVLCIYPCSYIVVQSHSEPLGLKFFR